MLAEILCIHSSVTDERLVALVRPGATSAPGRNSCNHDSPTAQELVIMTDTTKSHCPKCSAPIPEDAPQGLCPKCMLCDAATVPTTSVSKGRRTPPPSIEEIAAHFPEYEIVELIGAGGMGAVYKARQSKLDRFVALKILSHDLAADPAFEERFHREARVLARLNHPNIVAVYDFGTAGPYCYLLMEYVDGVNLRQAMQSGGFTAADTLKLVQDLCTALKLAHEEGVLHRDIKPENVLIDSRGRVRIADFGIAKLVGTEDQNDVTLTMQGAILGSPQYMAPEQLETPGDVDQRADIYSLGVVFYELLTGELPLGRFAPPSEKSQLDSRIDEIVMRTLEKEREARFQSAGEVRTEVEAISHPVPSAKEESLKDAPTDDAPMKSQPSARLALPAAICTGVALLIAGAAFVSLPLVFNDPTLPGAKLALYLGLAALATGVPTLLGIVFGSKALSVIRQSGGALGGLGSSMFAVLTLPSIVIVALTATLVAILFSDQNVGLTWYISLVIIGMIAGPLVLVHFVRTLKNWAQGRRQGGIASSALFTIMTIIAQTTAINVMPLHSSRPDPKPSRQVATSQTIASSSTVEERRKERWENHWKEPTNFIGIVNVPKKHSVEFRLIRVDSVGTEKMTKYWSAIATDHDSFKGIVAFGAPAGLQSKQNEGVAALYSTFWSDQEGPELNYSQFFEGKLVLKTLQTQLNLSEPTQRRIELGVLIPMGVEPSSPEIERVLLELVCAPRARQNEPLQTELIGMGTASEVIQKWSPGE